MHYNLRFIIKNEGVLKVTGSHSSLQKW